MSTFQGTSCGHLWKLDTVHAGTRRSHSILLAGSLQTSQGLSPAPSHGLFHFSYGHGVYPCHLRQRLLGL
jgi:hypothetical protein